MKNTPFVWQGRVDAEDGDAGLRIHQKVQSFEPHTAKPGITFVGLASDLGVVRNQGRAGAAQGPNALRRALASMACHVSLPIHDAGDTHLQPNQPNTALETAQDQYAKHIATALAHQQHVIGLGGGHEIGWGSYQGVRRYLDAEVSPQATLGILNFDAHFDLRKPPNDVAWQGSSGTPFYQVAQHCAQHKLPFHYACLGISQAANTQALFTTAQRLNVQYLEDVACEQAQARSLIDGLVTNVDHLYVSICLDVLPAETAPGVSAPAAYGVPMSFVIQCLNHIQHACQQHGTQWLMTDVAELNPTHDIDQHTAKAAARLVHHVVHQHGRTDS